MKGFRITINILKIAVIILLFILVPAILFLHIFKLPDSPNTKAFAGLEFAEKAGDIFGQESVIMAIEKSLKIGVKAIQIDVKLSKDGKLTVFQEIPLINLSDTVLPVINEKKQAIFKNHLNKIIYKELLNDVLPFALKNNLKIDLNLETGSSNRKTVVEELIQTFQKLNTYKNVFVSSFDPIILYMIRKQEPNVITALKLGNNISLNRTLNNLLLSPLLPDLLGVGIVEPTLNMADEKYFKKMISNGYTLNILQVNELKRKHEFLKKGFSVTTACPFLDCCTIQK